MTKSKSKPRPVRAPRYFVALHQDSLLEACARGFVAPQTDGLEADVTITQQALDRARGDAQWGDVVLIEVAGNEDRGASAELAQPLILTEVAACWVRSAEVASEIEARLETFDDTIPSTVEIKVDPKLFLQAGKATAQSPLPLSPNQSEPESTAGSANNPELDAVALEKIAGAVSMIRSRAKQTSVPLGLLEQMLTVPAREGPAQQEAIRAFASHAYRVLRPGQTGGGDEQVFVAAADSLFRTTPQHGIEPVSFVEQIVAGEESRSFVDTLRKVMDNRIELSDSKLDDSGMVGQRALLVFLLAPRAEELERWLRARPVGSIVSLLASLLSGLYCGIGSISRTIKGPGAPALLAAVDSARTLLTGKAPSLYLERHWDPSACLVERLIIGNRELVERKTPPSEELMTLLTTARGKGLETRVDPQTGDSSVVMSTGACVQLAIVSSTLRIPSSTITRLRYRGRSPKRGQVPKDVVSALLDESLRPAVASVDAIGEVRLDLEMDLMADVAEGVSHLMRCAESLGLVQESAGAKKPTRKRARTNLE